MKFNNTGDYRFVETYDANGCPYDDPFSAYMQMQCLLAGKWVGRSNMVVLMMDHFTINEEDAFFIVDRRFNAFMVDNKIHLNNSPLTDEEVLIYERYLRLSDELK